MKAAASFTTLAVAGILGVAACAGENSPAALRAPGDAVFNLFGSSATAGELIVCKSGTSANFSVVFSGNFDSQNIRAGITPAGGTTYTFSLAANACVTVLSRPVVDGVTSDPVAQAVVTELDPSPNSLVNIATESESDGGNLGVNLPARTGTVQFNMFHDARVTFTNAPPPPVLHSGGSGTWQGASFSDLDAGVTDDALELTASFKNTSGSQKTISVTDISVQSVIANLGGGNQANITGGTTCTFSPDPSAGSPVNIPPDASASFSITCDLPFALAAGNEVNIKIRAVINNGSQQYYERTYTLKAS